MALGAWLRPARSWLDPFLPILTRLVRTGLLHMLALEVIALPILLALFCFNAHLFVLVKIILVLTPCQLAVHAFMALAPARFQWWLQLIARRLYWRLRSLQPQR